MNIWRFILFWIMKTIYRYTWDLHGLLVFLLFFNGVPVLFKVNVPPFKSSLVFDNTHTIKYTNLHFIVHWYSSGQKVILSSWRAHLLGFGDLIAEVEGSLQNCCIQRRCHDDTDVNPESICGGMYDGRNLFWYTTNIHIYYTEHNKVHMTEWFGFFFYQY